jgi:uracil-DNA glycosylase
MQGNLFKTEVPKIYEDNLSYWASYFPISYTQRFLELLKEIQKDRERRTIWPREHEVFNAFKFFKPEDTKVIILGQDPYHDGQANGLAFGCRLFRQKGISPSLKQIGKAITNSTGQTFKPGHNRYPDLYHLARQGVLLLNTALTVADGKPGSHANHSKIDWKKFIIIVFDILEKVNCQPIVMLWGSHAKSYDAYAKRITREDYILKANHPVSASYNDTVWKCNHFKVANDILVKQGKKEIKWI